MQSISPLHIHWTRAGEAGRGRCIYIKIDIVGIDFGQGVCHTRQVDHDSFRGENFLKDEVREEEMPKVVCGKMTFDPVLGLFIRTLACDAGVVDEYIDLVDTVGQFLCCFSNGSVV